MVRSEHAHWSLSPKQQRRLLIGEAIEFVGRQQRRLVVARTHAYKKAERSNIIYRVGMFYTLMQDIIW